MFKKSLMFMITVLVTFFLAAGVSFAVDLGDDVETGMYLSEVEDIFELNHYKTARGMVSYNREGTGTFYFFDKETEELIYKLVVMSDKKWDKIKSMLERKCGEPVVEKDSQGNNIYFFADGDTGFKMSKNDTLADDTWQLWYGSISMWNEVAKENGMNEFPK